MGKDSELFVGLDASKLKISVAVAEGERSGEVRFFGDISGEPASVASMVGKLAKRGAKLHFCYEAGPTGYLSLIHISEPTRLLSISYAVFCLKKKNTQ